MYSDYATGLTDAPTREDACDTFNTRANQYDLDAQSTYRTDTVTIMREYPNGPHIVTVLADVGDLEVFAAKVDSVDPLLVMDWLWELEEATADAEALAQHTAWSRAGGAMLAVDDGGYDAGHYKAVAA